MQEKITRETAFKYFNDALVLTKKQTGENIELDLSKWYSQIRSQQGRDICLFINFVNRSITLGDHPASAVRKGRITWIPEQATIGYLFGIYPDLDIFEEQSVQTAINLYKDNPVMMKPEEIVQLFNETLFFNLKW